MDEMCKQLFTNGALRSLSIKLAGDLHDDLIQEVALALLESGKEVKPSFFEFWCVRTMINMTSKTGSFWRKYSERYIDQNEIRFQNELQYDPKPDEFWNELDEIFSKQEWYKKEMLKTYFECGSYRNIEKETGINYGSARHTTLDAINIIKERYDTCSD